MDLSPWYKLNPLIRVYPTQKKFYNKFDYKIVYKVPGAFVIPCTKDDQQLRNRIAQVMTSKYTRHPIVSVPLIEDFYKLYINRGTDTRIRIEGSSLSLFGTSLEQLYELTATQLKQHVNALVSVTAPVDQRQQELLDQGKILLKKPIKHQYRVTLRTGPYRNFNDRRALVQYLINLDDQVGITTKLLNQLEGNNKYLYGGYFYVSDLRLVDMISLIIPNLVRSVNQVVVP